MYWSNLEKEIVELEKLEAGPRAQDSNLKVPSDKKRNFDEEKLSRRMEGLSLRTTYEEITRVVLELSRLSLQDDTPSGRKTEMRAVCDRLINLSITDSVPNTINDNLPTVCENINLLTITDSASSTITDMEKSAIYRLPQNFLDFYYI